MFKKVCLALHLTKYFHQAYQLIPEVKKMVKSAPKAQCSQKVSRAFLIVLYFVYMINMYFTNTVFEELDTSLMTECP